MRAKWTRDEAILALDVLFSAEGKPLSMDNPAIIELGALLQRLPLIPTHERPDTFRNVAGVSRQLSTLQWGIKNNKATSIGDVFYEVYNQFKDKQEMLHCIAQAIRRCVELIRHIEFATKGESEEFYEGILLENVHRYMEKRYGNDYLAMRCSICSLDPQYIYTMSGDKTFLQAHLLIPPEQYEPDMKLSKHDFITVCPNCHTMLHQFRPWLGAENANIILKTL